VIMYPSRSEVCYGFIGAYDACRRTCLMRRKSVTWESGSGV
jgi:hypothetical protein